MRAWIILLRSCRLRCPRCGRGRLFRHYFAMHQECDHCGLSFFREPGFYLGSIYINYGLTAGIVTVSYLALAIVWGVSPRVLLWAETAFCLLFPIWFFRYARSLWLGFDQYVDPPE